MLTKGAPATRLAMLHFLARHAYFATDAGSQVSMPTLLKVLEDIPLACAFFPVTWDMLKYICSHTLPQVPQLPQQLYICREQADACSGIP